MNQRRQRLRASPTPLWQRILERHRYKGRLLRPRVPLVLRLRRQRYQAERRTALPPQVTQYALNLHLQLCWPFVSVQDKTLHDTHLHSNSAQNFLWLMPGRSLSSQSHTQRSALINCYTIALGQPNNLYFGSTVFRNAGSLLPVQTRAVVEVLRQANATNTLTHVSHNVNQAQSVNNELHATNKSIEVQEARKIFAGMLLQHSNLATHITSKIFASSTLVDRKGEIRETPKIPTRPHPSAPNSGSKQSNPTAVVENQRQIKSSGPMAPALTKLHSYRTEHDVLQASKPATVVENQRQVKSSGSMAPALTRLHSYRTEPDVLQESKPAAVVENQRQVKSSGPMAPALTKLRSYRAEHEVLQHTTTFRARQVNIETPISHLQSTVGSPPALPTSTRVLLAAPPATSKANGNGPGALTTVLPPLYTQPVTRNFATQPARDETGSQSQGRTMPAASPQINIPAPQQPALDIGRLTDEVYRHIQRKIRVERERRGL